jgi:hypothetical protein
VGEMRSAAFEFLSRGLLFPKSLLVYLKGVFFVFEKKLRQLQEKSLEVRK